MALLAGAKAARGAEHSAWLLAETLSHEPAPQPETDLLLPAAAWGALLAGQVLVESAQLSELATEMKSYAKTLPGSVFVVDRRHAPEGDSLATGEGRDKR